MTAPTSSTTDLGSASGKASGQCNGRLIMSNSASAVSQGNGPVRTKADAFVNFSGVLNVTEPVNLSINGTFTWKLQASIQGWDPGDRKDATSQVIAGITLNATSFFNLPPKTLILFNENDNKEMGNVETIMLNIPLEPGSYQLSISSLETAETFVKQTPESSSLLSLLALGAASTLKRKLESSQSTEKETTKVG